MKSHEKDSLMVLAEVYKDYASMCGVDLDSRDLEKIRSRVEHEGYQFLTITLPALGASFEACLERQSIESDSFKPFRKAKKSRSPRLFGVFFDLVFHTSGTLLLEPDPRAIAAIRQLSYLFKKQKEACSNEKTAEALLRYKEVERELAMFPVRGDDLADFSRISHHLWHTMLSQIEIQHSTPHHGPGATADRVLSNQKYTIKQWYDRLEGFFPLFSFGLPSESAYDSKTYHGIESVKQEDEMPVRVISVPKTAKTPRIIAIEPTCMQYTQQAVARALMRTLELSPITSGHINFSDQKVNRQLALQGSVDRRTATLDLSDASDRVRNDLVAPMFVSNPDLWGAIQACRSTRAKVGDDILSLSKFASMGSALCFPIESMFFYTLSVLGILRSRKVPLERAAVIDAARETYVYGDDIIVPVDTAPEVIRTLHSFGCKVNVAKSFINGYFRESCGMDAYAGQDVTPVYLRRIIPNDGKDAASVLSLISASNQFYKIGLWLTATVLKRRVERLIGKLPVLGDDSEAVGWSSFMFREPNTYKEECDLLIAPCKARYSKTLHRVEYHTYVAKPAYKQDSIDDYAALMKFFIESSPLCIGGVDTTRDLERSSRFGTVTLKRRWTRPY